MQDIHGFHKLCDVHDTEDAVGFTHPDFPSAWSNYIKGLPVVGIQTCLNFA